MVLTSHGTLGDTGKKTGFWLEEFASPYYAFIDAGANVTLASPRGGQPPIDPKSSAPDSQTPATQRFEQDQTAQDALANTIPLQEVNADSFDGIFFPGGHGPMWDLAMDPTNAKLVSTFYAQNKPIGAVCHGPAALVQAVDQNGRTILHGRSLTSFTNTEEKAVELLDVVPFQLETRLVELGGTFSKAEEPFTPHVVVDGLLITGQNPASSEPAAEAMLKVLKTAV